MKDSRMQRSLQAADRIMAGTPAVLFIWFVISVVLNLVFIAERAKVVTFHPEALTGLYAWAEYMVEGALQWGSVGVTLVVGIRALKGRIDSTEQE